MIFNRSTSSKSCRVLAWLLAFALLLPGSWGCALFRDPVPPVFETISIQVEVERDKKGSIEGDLAAYSTLKGVLVGTATGMPTLAIAGGGIAFGPGLVVCGTTLFLWPICVAFVTMSGVVVGGIVGLVGGGAMGFVGGLPSETAKGITAVLARLEDERSFDDDLLHAVRGAVPQNKQVDTAEAEATLTARFRKFDLRQHSRDRLSVRLWASMVQTWQGKDGKPKENTCKYRYDSERKDAETWLADEGVAFGEAVTQGFEAFARWMNRDLESFATKTEQPENDEDPESCFRVRHWYNFFY